jgi:hypothetical protein
MDGQTLGNFEPFYTHVRLEFAPGLEPKGRSKAGLEHCARLSADEVRRHLSAPAQVFPDSGLQLAPKPGMPYRPYLLAAVDTHVVKDHTDIGQPHFVCWLNQLADARQQ